MIMMGKNSVRLDTTFWYNRKLKLILHKYEHNRYLQMFGNSHSVNFIIFVSINYKNESPGSARVKKYYFEDMRKNTRF